MIRKISLALMLMTMAGAASAAGGSSEQCYQILWWNFCFPSFSPSPSPVQAPEIDPASAMAGLTLLAGGLAVLRGRRGIETKE